MSAEAKTIRQTKAARTARDFEGDFLFGANRLCAAVFAKGLSAAEDCLSLFSAVAEKPLAETNQQTAAPSIAFDKRAQSAIERRDN